VEAVTGPIRQAPLEETPWWQPAQKSTAMRTPKGRAIPGSPPPNDLGGAGFGDGVPYGTAQQPSARSEVDPAAVTRIGNSRRRTFLGVAAVALALVAGFVGGAVQERFTATSSTTTTQLGSAPAAAAAGVNPVPAGSVEQVAAGLLPSVVSVLSSSTSSSGEGSGIIVSSGGLILTNNHVVAGATALVVQFNDSTTAAATVVGADATDDLAVLKAGVTGLVPATLGTSADISVGQPVVAIGSPLGLSATVTSGIVSALNRPVRTSSTDQQTPSSGQSTTNQDTVMNAVQTDAAINPGNSGGPLVDMAGRVIGINSAIASLSSSSSGQAGSIGVGFSIPIDQAKRVAQEIIDTGHATHAVLGASVSDATTGTNSLLTVGASIGQVTAGSGADTAGLKAGDVITTVGDQHIDSADALIATIRAATPGGQVSITYTRGNTTDNTASVTLGTATSN
jgi:putative serine protease PepD